MADKIPQKTNNLLPETYYIGVYISNYKKTHISKVQIYSNIYAVLRVYDVFALAWL